MAAVLIPEVLHPLAGVEVAVSGAVELAVLHGDEAAGIVRAAVGIDSLPLRLIAEVAVVYHITSKIQLPVAVCVKLDVIVFVVRLAQPDTLEAAEVVDGVLAEAASQALVGVILRGDLPLRIAAGCAQQEKQQHQSRQKIWLFSLHVIFLLILHRSNTAAKKYFDRSHPYPPQHRGVRRSRKDRYKCRCP